MNTNTMRPDFVTDEHLKYLDDLRESGVTNMFGATPFIRREFRLREGKAKEILLYWMKTFSERHPKQKDRGGENPSIKE